MDSRRRFPRRNRNRAERRNPMNGKLYVIEGVDGSGKATQTELLYQALLAEGKSVRKVSFPDYDSPSSSLIKMYLNGEFGTDPQSVNAFATSVFFAVDRFASFRKDWQEFYQNDGIIIADRYVTGGKWKKWRDIMLLTEGEAVYGMQTSFLVDWYFADRSMVSGSRYYPKMELTSGLLAQVVTSKLGYNQ